MQVPRFLKALLQPHYLYRPGQLLRRIYREWLRPLPNSALASLPWGHSLRITPTENIGRAVWLHGLYGTPVCELLWRLTDSGMTVVDGGANIGVMTSLLAHRIAPKGTVYAFEPHPALYSRLADNVRRIRSHARSAVYPLPFALDHHTGTSFLTWDDTFAHNQGLASLSGSSDSSFQASVSCTTLDALFPSTHLHLLKLDVEGHEPDVLAGADALLRDGRIDHVVYECHEGPRAPIHDRLTEYGYTPFALGTSLFGLTLLPLDACSSSSLDIVPSFLATAHPGVAQAKLSAGGWRCLTGTE